MKFAYRGSDAWLVSSLQFKMLFPEFFKYMGVKKNIEQHILIKVIHYMSYL
jgi:hypothetical protein